MVFYRAEGCQPGLYGFSYQALKDDYWRFRSMTNEEFLKQLIPALHFAVFTCWLKEASCDVMGDTGLIHQLVHLLDPKTRKDSRADDLARIRMDFNEVCELA